MPSPMTVLHVPRSLSRDTRDQLPTPTTALFEVNDAIDVYADARRREREARDQAEAAKAIFLPVAREVFARHWVERGARPKAPLAIQSLLGNQVPIVVEERRGTRIDETTAEKLEEAIGDELYRELVMTTRRLKFNDELLADPGVRRKLKAAIEASDLSDDEKAALVEEVPVFDFRESIEGGLVAIAAKGWNALARALTALSAVVRAYPTLEHRATEGDACEKGTSRPKRGKSRQTT